MSEEVKKIDFKSYLNVYEFETILPGSKETVKFKPITTGQLKKMLVYENERDPMVIENGLDELISSSVISEGFDINKLYLQDRFFLLIELRKKSKGEKYSFQYNCPSCGSQSVQVIDLTKLNVKPLSKDIDNLVKLDSKISVEMSHITRGKQREAYRIMTKDKSLNDSQRITEMALLTHAASIEAIVVPEGRITDSSISDRKYLLENIPTDAYTNIRDWFDNNDFGVEFKYTVRCTCGREEHVDIPVDNFFF